MDINIIHLPEQEDRKSNVVDLAMLLGEAKIIHGAVPLWESHPSAKSVRGCALSHLNSLYNQKANEPLLVLEDDASLYKNIWQELQENKIPEDCGVLIIGGDCENFIDSEGFFLKLQSPFYGSHAVWYNTPLLRERGFLTHAYQLLASSGMGDTDNYNGLCYESILMAALTKCGLNAYRPRTMMFTTIESKSSRLNEVMPPRDKVLIVE